MWSCQQVAVALEAVRKLKFWRAADLKVRQPLYSDRVIGVAQSLVLTDCTGFFDICHFREWKWAWRSSACVVRLVIHHGNGGLTWPDVRRPTVSKESASRSVMKKRLVTIAAIRRDLEGCTKHSGPSERQTQSRHYQARIWCETSVQS